jgi:hypothetical protein
LVLRIYGATYFHTSGSGLGDGIRPRPDGWALIEYIGRQSGNYHYVDVSYLTCGIQAAHIKFAIQN